MTIEFKSNKLGIPLSDVLYRIEYADPEENEAMIDAVQRRYSRLFPDWEVTFLSLNTGNRVECAQQVEGTVQLLKKMYLE